MTRSLNTPLTTSSAELLSEPSGNDLALDKLSVKTETHIEVLTLQGRLDAAYVHSQKDLFNILPGQASTPLVVDLQDVSFIDSTGLGFLVMLGKKAATQGRSFALCNPSKQAQMLFELTRLHQVFDLFPTLALARGSMTAEVR
jgi:anti-sigma B factor antagonist